MSAARADADSTKMANRSTLDSLAELLRQRERATIGGLELGELLGRGSFGRVYKGASTSSSLALSSVCGRAGQGAGAELPCSQLRDSAAVHAGVDVEARAGWLPKHLSLCALSLVTASRPHFLGRAHIEAGLHVFLGG